jgi:hypothetical protein
MATPVWAAIKNERAVALGCALLRDQVRGIGTKSREIVGPGTMIQPCRNGKESITNP